ncbi:hypothetical protein AGMMS50293_14970 [Spirochaetia bacterium]|nr:hypothetical protein AGMMS50293_14970 [Spirochaetia bacterium]
MPTYEYECKSCGHTFEAFQAMRDEPLKVCPECGKEIRRLIFGGTGVIFKGSGFYVTDKGKGSSGAAPKTVKTTETPSSATADSGGSEKSAASKSGSGESGSSGSASVGGTSGDSASKKTGDKAKTPQSA